MLGVRTVECRCVDERIVGAQRSAIAEIAQRSVSRAVAAADDQRWPSPVGEPNLGAKFSFCAFPNVSPETQSSVILLLASNALNEADLGTWQP